MTLTEMLAKQDKLAAALLKARIETESLFAAEKARHHITKKAKDLWNTSGK